MSRRLVTVLARVLAGVLATVPVTALLAAAPLAAAWTSAGAHASAEPVVGAASQRRADRLTVPMPCEGRGSVELVVRVVDEEVRAWARGRGVDPGFQWRVDLVVRTDAARVASRAALVANRDGWWRTDELAGVGRSGAVVRATAYSADRRRCVGRISVPD